MIGLEEVPCAAEDAAAVAATALGAVAGSAGEGREENSESEESSDEGEKMEQFLTLEHLCERFKGIDNDATLVCAYVLFSPLSLHRFFFWSFRFPLPPLL